MQINKGRNKTTEWGFQLLNFNEEIAQIHSHKMWIKTDAKFTLTPATGGAKSGANLQYQAVHSLLPLWVVLEKKKFFLNVFFFQTISSYDCPQLHSFLHLNMIGKNFKMNVFQLLTFWIQSMIYFRASKTDCSELHHESWDLISRKGNLAWSHG